MKREGLFRAIAVAAIATALAGCGATMTAGVPGASATVGPAGPAGSGWKQLTEASFSDIRPGMTSDQVLAQLGRPSHVFGAGWQDHYQVWNYRWAGADCVWFQVSINDSDRRVRDASMAPDPRCDGPNSRD